jgi:hypothetical protein
VHENKVWFFYQVLRSGMVQWVMEYKEEEKNLQIQVKR